MSLKHNKLTPAEEELLAKLTEECGEVSQMVGKTLVHGWENFSPSDPEKEINREKLQKEIGGLLCVVAIMVAKDMLDWDAIETESRRKQVTIWKYLHEQGEHVATGQTVVDGKEGTDSENRRGGCC